MPTPEAFARVKIDAALKDSEWDLLDTSQVRLEATGRSGRADYILIDELARPLCVLEAKKENEDPYDAKDQARGYAENLKAPFIILSNGTEHWFWNYTQTDQDAYRIERLPRRSDLVRLSQKNLQPPRPLFTEQITPAYLHPLNPDIKLRTYQIRAIDQVSREFDHQGKRKFLLEMATGTGKTLLCAALIRRFLKTRRAERVLFIVDRIELAKQAMEDFNVILREYNPVIFKTARLKPMELLGSSVVVATIQSLIVDRRYRTEFSPFHFDLVINDEAHRSIYGDAREVVQFFQATRVGLTATPKAYLKNIDLERLQDEHPKSFEARQLRDTYHYFGCEPGVPTFRYDIIDAVQDPEGPFLCMPVIHDIRSDITTQALADNGWSVVIDEQTESIKVQDLERKIFTPERNRVMCAAFLDHAKRAPDGKIGQSIVFAVNQRHATELTKIFNELAPNSAITITSRIPDASTIAKDFRDGKRPEPIAVSVDMLSTGYNCKPLLNVALMRPIFSPTEYIQIKGRGTRRYTFKIGNTAYEKDNFYILDFCAVAEYFDEKYDYTAPLPLPRPRVRQGESDEGNAPPHITRDPNATYAGSGIDVDSPAAEPLKPPREIPVWEGTDIVKTVEVRIIGPNGEKVDVMTFRGSFERDLRSFADQHPDLTAAVSVEDDDTVETILQEQFFHRPEMFYSPDKLVRAYGVPAPTPAFVYNALGKKTLPAKETIITDTVDSIAARFNLRYKEQKWLSAVAQLVADDPVAMQQFLAGGVDIFNSHASMFNQLGGLRALVEFTARDQVFDALRQSPLVRQSQLGVTA